MNLTTFDGHNINDGTNYIAVLPQNVYGLPAVEPLMAPRQKLWPTISGIGRPGREIYIELYIRNETNKIALQTQLQQWFNPEDETPKLLVAAGNLGRDVFLRTLCKSLQRVPGSRGLKYIATLQISGDVRWRSVNFRSVTDGVGNDYMEASGGIIAHVINNAGDDESYPVLTITPVTSAGLGYAYRRFVVVHWYSDSPARNYPVDICNDAFDTAALVTASKMQADGDDLRVFVDGREVERWLDGINTTTTKVWINLDFAPNASGILAASISTTGPITSIQSTQPIDDFPDSGIIKIENEMFSYTSKNIWTREFLGITRAVNSTSAAMHTAPQIIYWIQHEIWIAYGNTAATASSADLTNKPIFDLSTSTNAQWDFKNFYYETPMGGKILQLSNFSYWRWEQPEGFTIYQGNHGITGDPAGELGIRAQLVKPNPVMARLKFYNPCGIAAANFQSGEKYALSGLTTWLAELQSSFDGLAWYSEYQIAAPSTTSAWESWSYNITDVRTDSADMASHYIALALYGPYATPIATLHEIECSEVILDIQMHPTMYLLSEQGHYQLDTLIWTDELPAETLRIQWQMDGSQSIEVDCDFKTVRYLKDYTWQYQALTLNSVRRTWFRLLPGDNHINATDAYNTVYRIAMRWKERMF